MKTYEQSIAQLRGLVSAKQLIEARNFCVDLTSQYSQDINIWRMRISLHFQLGELNAVAECSRILIQLSYSGEFTPELSATFYALLTIFHDMGRFHDLILVRERLLEVYPTNTPLHYLLGKDYLRLGDFQRGWAECEWRHKDQAVHVVDFCHGNPKWWDGSVLTDKIILVRTEQGKGDIIQFSRYLPLLKTLGAKIILDLRSHPSLAPLLERYVDQIVVDYHQEVAWDMETNLLSLPGIFQTSLNNIPGVPYLETPKAAGKAAIAAIDRHYGKLWVGLVWAGNKTHPNDPLRSLKLTQLNELLTNREVQFFSLQKEIAANELLNLADPHVIDLAPHLNDFADTAAAIQELDLVISADTAVAHLAGALRKPVWTLIPFVPDWRWMLDREDSPWYPTMRLFRQPAPGDWSSVIARVAAQLTALIQEQSSTGAVHSFSVRRPS
jgi:hypothetical protein